MESRQLGELAYVVSCHPIIDNHAHNLLLPSHSSSQSFLSLTSEAGGEALEDSKYSLANARARKQLKELYKCSKGDWQSILDARAQTLQSRDELLDRVFWGVHTILMDDGLDSETVHHYTWHDRYCIGKTKRIVRIEVVAESILKQQIMPNFKERHTIASLKDLKLVETVLENLGHTFHDSILHYTSDNEVAGFKSIICYRTGLCVNIQEHTEKEIDELVGAFAKWFERCLRGETSKVNSKIINDWLVSITMFILSRQSGHVKPIQFHTGFGDNDLSLTLANPALLQPLIEKFPRVPIVLLHSAYPFTREAGYLASVYSNVYLDLGLAFPMLSRNGQLSTLREAMELVPTTKLLWSTDGHWFGETYYIANKQFREGLGKILAECVQEEDLTEEEAIKAAKDILFRNSNHLYNLRIRLEQNYRMPAAAQSSGSLQSGLSSRETFESKENSKLSLLSTFERRLPTLTFVYVQWYDYMGTLRCRILPITEFRLLVEKNSMISISRGNEGTLQDDTLTSKVDTTGQICIQPDLNSIRPTHNLDSLRTTKANEPKRTSATVLSDWCDESGEPLGSCPRSTVRRLVSSIEKEFGIELLLGCEIEVVFLRRSEDGKSYSPYTKNHAWGTMSAEQWQGLPLLREIHDGLATIGVEIQQMHSESGQGQYEFVLPPLPVLAAIDTLLQARQVICQIAQLHNVRATFHPAPFHATGTASHMHLSLNSRPSKLTPDDLPSEKPHEADLKVLEVPFFIGGILKHLRAACAFLLPSSPSYARVKDDSWTGGTWLAWGTQNRETPLRKIVDGRWEMRCIDGMGNGYLALASILTAGLLGLRENRVDVEVKDCLENPSKLDEERRLSLGIKERLPRSLRESLEALQADEDFKRVMGARLVEIYCAMKVAEQRKLERMEENERHIWLVERY